jgi:hypothetical protein
MEAININNVGGNRSNYRFRGEPVQLMVRTAVLDENKEIKGFVECTVDEVYRTQVRVCVSRKQKAAREAVPRAHVVVVKEKPVVVPEVALARLEGRSERDVAVAALEAKVKELLGIVEFRKNAEARRQASIKALELAFNSRHSR